MKKITPQTKLYGVIGNPIAHSKSPKIFNYLFNEFNLDAVYHYWKIADEGDLKKFLTNLKLFNIRGLSVTLPFKKKVINHLDRLDSLAEKLNCVNTILVENETLIGYNFDGLGAILPLTKIKNWEKLNYLFLGLGGAAEGIILTLIQVYNPKGLIGLALRDRAKGKTFKKKINSLEGKKVKNINCEIYDLNELTKLNSPSAKSILNSFDVIINTTPLGMKISNHPENQQRSPLEKKFITSKHIVYDIVYNPLMTTLLKDALNQKARIIQGHKMFLEQARKQFKLWTNEVVPINLMEQIFFK